MAVEPTRSAPRCPSCGSRLHGGERTCPICGAALPWRLSPGGVALESLAALAVVVLVIGALLFVRNRSRVTMTPAEETAYTGLVSELPTAIPTFTPAPPAAPTAEPGAQPAQSPASASEEVTYTVKSGDTLYGIAQDFGVTADSIMESNPVVLADRNSLSIGDELRIQVDRPAGAQAPAPAVAGASGAPSKPGGAGGSSGSAAPGASGSSAGKPGAGEGAAAGGVAPSTGVTATQSGGISTTVTDATAGLDASEALSGSLSTLEISTTNGAGRYPAPIPLAPGDTMTVTDESAILRWSSVGILPDEVYYVVLLRTAGQSGSAGTDQASSGQAGAGQAGASQTDEQAEVEWVFSNATALRVPGRLRPALGSSREIEWAVTVRRRGESLVGVDAGTPLSPPPEWQRFTWSPQGSSR